MTMIRRMVFLGLTASLCVGGAAFAAEAPLEAEPEVRKFNFDGDTISTDYLKPGTIVIEGLRRGRRSSLIEVRLDFVAEILRSAEDI